MHNLALVTGATGGLGSVITARLIQEGYTVLALARDAAQLARLAEETATPGRVQPVVFDVCSPQSAWYLRMFEMVQEHGEPDLLVVAHGAAPAVMPTVALEGHRFADVMLTDVWGTFMACQTLGAYMVRRQHGSIVLLSSVHAHLSYPQRTAYSTAKSAICGLARSLAIEWGVYGITTNVILPWQVTGPRTQAFMDEAKAQGYDLEEAYQQRSPMRRLITPGEVADAVVFLVRNRAMNGCELVLDGGVSQSMWYKPFLGT